MLLTHARHALDAAVALLKATHGLSASAVSDAIYDHEFKFDFPLWSHCA